MERSGLSGEAHDVLKLATEKWSSYVGDNHRSQAISLMLEAQQKEFVRIRENTPEIAEFFTEHFGASWDEHFLRAYAKALRDHPLLDFFPPQPMCGPIGSVGYFEMRSTPADLIPTEEGAAIPEIHMDVRLESVTARGAAYGNILAPIKGTEALTEDSKQKVMETFCWELVQKKMQTLVGTILHNNTSALTFDQQPGETLRDAIQQAGYRVHKRTMRGPSNRLACNSKISVRARDDSRWFTWADSEFPEDGVATWYSGPSLLDQPVIWAPYVISFYKDEVEQADADGNNKEKIPVLRAGFRDAVYVANAGMIQTLAIKKPGTT